MASSISAGATTRRLSRRRRTGKKKKKCIYGSVGRERCVNLCALCRDFALGKTQEEKKLLQLRERRSISGPSFISFFLVRVCQCYRRVHRRYSQDSRRPQHLFPFFFSFFLFHYCFVCVGAGRSDSHRPDISLQVLCVSVG